MTNSNEAIESSSALVVRLPDTAFTRSGISFRPNDDVWRWTDGPYRLSLDFRRIEAHPVLQEGLKHTLLAFAKSSSGSHLSNLFYALTNFLELRSESTPLASITAQAVSNYITRLEAHEKYRIGTLNVLLQKWSLLRLHGVDPECTRYLRERRKQGADSSLKCNTCHRVRSADAKHPAQALSTTPA